MYELNEVYKLGDKYYLISDIQKIFDSQIDEIDETDVILE